MACSKKCKKVAKFSYLLKRRSDETEILRQFEKMLKKKLQRAAPNVKHSVEVRNGPSLRTCQTDRLDANKRLGTSVEHQEPERFFSDEVASSMDEFSWDKDNGSKDIQYSLDGRHAFLHESNYYFRTIISSRPFMSGTHYWEIIADGRTEHELKIGVTCQQKFNVNSSFSDYEFGFAYYGLGQLRHGSNALGVPYGKPFKKRGVLGVCLNMNSGTLSFALDGEYMGVAYEDSQLKTGPIWAAVSLLHIAGCTLISGLEKPHYFVH